MRICTKCGDPKELSEFHYFKTRNYLNVKCKRCVTNQQTERNQQKKIDDGYKIVKNKPNVYNSESERKQTFELMERMGWEFNNENNVWFKDGFKTKDGKWIK